MLLGRVVHPPIQMRMLSRLGQALRARNASVRGVCTQGGVNPSKIVSHHAKESVVLQQVPWAEFKQAAAEEEFAIATAEQAAAEQTAAEAALRREAQLVAEAAAVAAAEEVAAAAVAAADAAAAEAAARGLEARRVEEAEEAAAQAEAAAKAKAEDAAAVAALEIRRMKEAVAAVKAEAAAKALGEAAAAEAAAVAVETVASVKQAAQLMTPAPVSIARKGPPPLPPAETRHAVRGAAVSAVTHIQRVARGRSGRSVALAQRREINIGAREHARELR